jgi:hypothetical protein
LNGGHDWAVLVGYRVDVPDQWDGSPLTPEQFAAFVHGKPDLIVSEEPGFWPPQVGCARCGLSYAEAALTDCNPAS